MRRQNRATPRGRVGRASELVKMFGNLRRSRNLHKTVRSRYSLLFFKLVWKRKPKSSPKAVPSLLQGLMIGVAEIDKEIAEEASGRRVRSCSHYSSSQEQRPTKLG